MSLHYYTNFSITSHYGDNRTDLVDMCEGNANNTEYCSYCHVNDTPFMQFENIIVNITHAGSANCEDCHGTGRLHGNNITRVNTTGNCTDCHALYGANRTAYMGNGTIKYEINVTAMNAGVHEKVNENMNETAGLKVNDSNNAKCWGCHVPNGTHPENGHKDTFNNDAYLCYECHNETYAYQNVSNATAVYNHFKSGINISARTTASTNSFSCGYGCHNLSTMKVPDFDAGGNATYRVNLSQSSHYPRSRPDIANESSNLSDCAWCHLNSTNEFITIFERDGTPHYTKNIPHATRIESCILTDCHRSGRIHDRNLTIPTWEWGDQCDDCHFGLDDFVVKEYYVNDTMFNQGVHANVGCAKCHVYNADQPTNWHLLEEYTWKWCECCHSYQADPINESDRHNVTADPANYSINLSGTLTPVLNIINCTTCHNATSYENANFNANAERDCRDCHSYPD